MKLPDFRYEKESWKKGFTDVAGIDEVGRGCCAGPVVAGCVILSTWGLPAASHPAIIINDSKKLTPKQRQKADKWIRENALAFGIGQASVAQINKVGIKKASEIAFRKAIKNCGSVDYLLIDAFYIPYVKGLRRTNQKAIVKGDTKSLSIASASIIAKVYRDKLMTKLSKDPKYRKYRWAKNKGYGTKEHRSAIKKYGISGQHRTAFVGTWLQNLEARNPKSQTNPKA